LQDEPYAACRADIDEQFAVPHLVRMKLDAGASDLIACDIGVADIGHRSDG
jgi:hypothetical protein